MGIVLDEENNEIFVHERKMLVYDLNGTFKRSFKYRYDYMFNRFHNYDRDHLFAFDFSVEFEDLKKRSAYHVIISKQDGSVISEVQIPFKDKKSTVIQYRTEDRIITHNPDDDVSLSSIFPYQGNWILSLPSADTVYMYLPDNSMLPFIARTPSIQSMDPLIFLFPKVFTEQYYFMRIMKKGTLNDEVMFPTTSLVYDRQERKFYECTVKNDDFTTKKLVYQSQYPCYDDKIVFWQRYEAHDLVEAYNNGELKGRLNEIATVLDEEDNPVIMLVKHKK